MPIILLNGKTTNSIVTNRSGQELSLVKYFLSFLYVCTYKGLTNIYKY